jgi:hypothetical protein
MTTDEGCASKRFLEVGSLSASELEALVVRGQTPSADALVGWEYRGMNTAPYTPLLGIRKFIKGFYADRTGRAFGYNIPAVQNGLTRPWIGLPSVEAPKRFGFYGVDRVEAEERDNAYLHALLLNYGRGGGAWYDVTATMRDYMVRVEPGSDDLLVGKAFVALGPLSVPVSYLVIERHRPSDFRR